MSGEDKEGWRELGNSGEVLTKADNIVRFHLSSGYSLEGGYYTVLIFSGFVAFV